MKLLFEAERAELGNGSLCIPFFSSISFLGLRFYFSIPLSNLNLVFRDNRTNEVNMAKRGVVFPFS
jgi:hypothetical protein